MTQLEGIYLANVVMFIDTLETAQKFTLINKKSKDAAEMLRINPSYTSQLLIDDPSYEAIKPSLFAHELELFPNLETVRIRYFSPFILNFIPKHVQRIVINDLVDADQIVSLQAFKERIVEMNIFSYDEPIDFSQFPNLKRLTLKVHLSDFNSLSKYFCSKTQRIDFVRINFLNRVDIDFLKQHLDYAIFKLVIEESKVSIDELLDIPNPFRRLSFCTKQWRNTLNDNVIITGTHWNYDPNPKFLLSLQQYFIANITVDSKESINLDSFNSINNVKLVGTNNQLTCTLPSSVTSLTYEKDCSRVDGEFKLKQLELIENFQNHPSFESITKLTISKTKLDDLKVFNNIKELYLSGVMQVELPFPKLTKLTKLTLDSCTLPSTISMLTNLIDLRIDINSNNTIDVSNFYPSSIQSLICNSNYLSQHMNITSLSIADSYYYRSSPENYGYLKNYTNLQHLTLSSTASHNIVFPTSLTKLKLSCGDAYDRNLCYDCSRFTNLQVMILEANNLNVKLPTSLKSLTLCRSINVNIMNINELHLVNFVSMNSKFNLKLINNDLKRLFIDSYNSTIPKDVLQHFTALVNVVH
ncbi:Uncharacterized protein QTN25_003722 [Entamoeba marina]